ncbi:hypothetical protein GCM10010129_20010 [Streptomyces fumigatiscleroticus]|nr:hypothetical protein GCM10010129_20010 [Streptomyces fumigatiscleroticus]
MARHTSSSSPTARRALVLLASAGLALGAGAVAASADTSGSTLGMMRTRPTSLGNIDPEAGLEAAQGTLRYVTGPVSGLKPNPLTGTGVDPLDNGVGTQVSDFQPVGSQALTQPVAQAQSVGSVPVAGQAAGLLGR